MSDNKTYLVIDRSQDGVTHINVWSKAKTELGQQLSNFANIPFTHPEYGTFASMEAFWYWAATGQTHQELRRLYGASAKSVGSKLPRVMLPEGKFEEMICEGLRCKLEQNAGLRNAFARSVLPLEHYFVYGRNNEVIVNQSKHKWQMDYLEKLRDEFRAGLGLEPAAEARLRNPEPIHKPAKQVGKDGWVEFNDKSDDS